MQSSISTSIFHFLQLTYIESLFSVLFSTTIHHQQVKFKWISSRYLRVCFPSIWKWNAIFNLMHAKKCHCMFRWNEFYVLSIPSEMLFSLPKICLNGCQILYLFYLLFIYKVNNVLISRIVNMSLICIFYFHC